ncbi:MAG: hypothetical protein ABEJ23_06245 [Haloarculaceae archaeon]
MTSQDRLLTVDREILSCVAEAGTATVRDVYERIQSAGDPRRGRVVTKRWTALARRGLLEPASEERYELSATGREYLS